MADVFISYSHEPLDRQAARCLAEILTQRGWSVFWDHRIAVGARWDLTLERELGDARSVVVLWSRSSRDRDWVREEAMEARKRGVLVAGMLEPVTPPLGLRLIQAADLTDWRCEPTHPGLVRLIEAIDHVLTTGGDRPAWRPTDLLGSGTRREVVATVAQVLIAGALPVTGYAAGLVPVSELSQVWVPAVLASLVTLLTVLGGLVASRWMRALWRVRWWAVTALLAGIGSVLAAGLYTKALAAGTVEVPVRQGNTFVLERRVKGTVLTSHAERYLKLHPELRDADDQKLIANVGPIDRVWTTGSIRALWWNLVYGYAATVTVIVLVLFAFAEALKIPGWRAIYALRPIRPGTSVSRDDD